MDLRGNGSTDSRDAIGARAYVEIPTASSTEPRRVYQTVTSSNGFSAQNELTLTFGLGADKQVSRLAILWNSGCLQIVEDFHEGLPAPKPTMVIEQGDCWTCSGTLDAVAAWLDPDDYGCRGVVQPSPLRTDDDRARSRAYHGEGTGK